MIRLLSIGLLLVSAGALGAPIVYCTTDPTITPTCLTITYPDVVCPAPPPCPTCPPQIVCPPPVAACTAPMVCVLPPPVVLPPPPLPAGAATLTWDLTPTATGYRIYTGTASGAYQALGTGILVTAPPYTTPILPAGFRYFFAVTAIYPTTESGFSNEVFKDIGVAPPPPPPPGQVESPAGFEVTVIGGPPIIDRVLASWTLGPKDPLVENGLLPVVKRNGVVNGTATKLCYSGGSVNAWSNGAWYRWGTTWTSVGTTNPVGCI